MKIRILPPELSDQIAAGEVVERPSSAAKELIENALDAGAKNIQIEIEDGGKKKILVRDDGSGMSAIDAELCVRRHATSKIQTIDDLFSVRSYGFRGEALAAISSVSRLTLTTKTSAENHGTQITIQGGKDKQNSPAPANTGTTIIVEDLFFPTPARLKHLKNSATEFGHIYKEIAGFALTHPEVSFAIHRDGKPWKQFPASSEFERIQRLLNIPAEKLIDLPKKSPTSPGLRGTGAEFSPLSITGAIIQPGHCQRTKKQQYLFVNNRRIEDYRLAFAIREAYLQSAGIEKHLHPAFVLFIEIDPILVDVNVHPRKLEVKFSEPNEIFAAVKHAAQTALMKNRNQGFSADFFPTNLVKNAPDSNKISSSQFRSSQSFQENLLKPTTSFSQQSRFRSTETTIPSQISARAVQSLGDGGKNNKIDSNPEDDLDNLRLVGQAANKYILATSEKGLWMFDQHALHERQRFEQFWNEFQSQLKSGKILSQRLLVSETVNLELEDVMTLFENQNEKELNRIGFQLKCLEDELVELLATPTILTGENSAEILTSLAAFFRDGQIGEHAISQWMRKRLEYKSCRGAVMFGDPLAREEMQKLLDDFLTTKWRNLCPHGRPNHTFIPFETLDQQFHR